MKNKRRLPLVLALGFALCTSGCGSNINTNSRLESEKSTETSASQTVTTVSEKPVETTSKETVPQLPEQKIVGNYMTYTKYAITKQAEDGKLSGSAKVASEREGFFGKGYVTGMTKPDQWSMEFEMPQSQYYNVAVAVATDGKKKNAIDMDGKRLSEFVTSGSGHFEVIIVKNNYFEKGRHTLTLENIDEKTDIDYCYIKASEDIANISFGLDNAELSNKDSDENTKALYSYLCTSYGQSVILGQHDSVGTTAETDLIYKTTGKYPAIRFGDLMLETASSDPAKENELKCAEKYAENGGLVGYMWHWTAPMDTRSYYASETKFDLSKAVTEEKIATLPIEEIRKLEQDKKISQECLAIINDIDTVSQRLAELGKKGISVIWRPLHEASNGYFWWGKDEKSYKWLWNLMYERQTKYHKLGNLIWVWSAQNANWYVGDSVCDIVSVDIYNEGNTSGNVNSLLFLQGISKKKPVAISECGSLPPIQSIADEKAMWTYIAQWGGNFIMNEDGSLSEQYNKKADLQVIYNNNLTVTRDKLPDAKKRLEDYKKAEEEKKKAAETTTTAVTTAAPGETTAASETTKPSE